MVATATQTGLIAQIIGPVVDVEFPSGELPKVYNALVISSDKVKMLLVKFNSF